MVAWLDVWFLAVHAVVVVVHLYCNINKKMDKKNDDNDDENDDHSYLISFHLKNQLRKQNEIYTKWKMFNEIIFSCSKCHRSHKNSFRCTAHASLAWFFMWIDWNTKGQALKVETKNLISESESKRKNKFFNKNC